jgi:hypothetical protein
MKFYKLTFHFHGVLSILNDLKFRFELQHKQVQLYQYH